jgi:hypothetical protein
LARKLQEEQVAEQADQRQFTNRLQLRRIANEEQQNAEAGKRFDQQRSDRLNAQGLELMGRDRKVYEDEEQQRRLSEGLAELEASPETPPALKKILRLRRIGVNATPSADMLLTEEERAAQDARSLKHAGDVADIQARTAARYREPKDAKEPHYEKVETVDDKGNPITKYMTPDEVRAEGGVRGAPKTTAKAQGPATVAAVLGEIDTLSKKINTGGSNPLTRIGGTVRSAAGAMNLDDAVAEYESLIAGFTPIVARAVGHTGVLTEQDVQSVRALFPKPGDSASLAHSKLARVRKLMAQIQPETGTGAGPLESGPSEQRGGPAIGEERVIQGQRARWDGRGWLPVK